MVNRKVAAVQTLDPISAFLVVGVMIFLVSLFAGTREFIGHLIREPLLWIGLAIVMLLYSTLGG